MKIGPKQYFVATACTFNNDNKALLTKRNSPNTPETHNLWQFPGGGIDYGESPDQAAQREVFEETGISIRITTQPPLISSHVFSVGKAHILLMIYSAEFVSGKIDFSKDSKETSDAGWFSLEEILHLSCMPKIHEQAKELFRRRFKALE